MDALSTDRLAPTAQTLAELLAAASRGKVAIADPVASIDVPLRDLGLDSIAYLAFLSRIEERFGISWGYDEPPETFETLGTLAARVSGAKGGPS